MALVVRETRLEAAAEKAWAMLRDVGAAARAFPGVLVASRLEGDSRIVTFQNGSVVRERILEVDDARRLVAYSVVEARFSQHHASMQIITEGPDRSRFVWISEFLPHDFEPLVRVLVDQGTAAFRRAVEAYSLQGP